MELQKAQLFPAHIHPHYGTVRPQRLPAPNYGPEDTPEALRPLRALCERMLADHVGHEVRGRECLYFYYPVGTQMHEHTDPDQGAHWRVNVVVRRAEIGGDLYLDDELVPMSVGDAYVFRADLVRHRVTPIEAGERLAFSLAFLLRG